MPGVPNTDACEICGVGDDSVEIQTILSVGPPEAVPMCGSCQKKAERGNYRDGRAV